MVRATNAVASRKRKKRLFKQAKGYVGDRKNHLRLTTSSVMRSLAYNYRHRKEKKREFRSLWITRIGAAAKMNGLSYSKFIHGLSKMECGLDRKILADMALRDPEAFASLANQAKLALA